MTDSLLQEGRNEGWFLNEELKAALVKTADAVVHYDVSGSYGFLGKAVIGSATSAAVWQIKRFTFAADGGVTTEYADGNAAFDNIWDNRASLSYS